MLFAETTSDTPTNSFLFYPGELEPPAPPMERVRPHPFERSDAIDAARAVLAGRLPGRHLWRYRVEDEALNNSWVKWRYLEPSKAVDFTGQPYLRTTLVGDPAELGLLNACETEREPDGGLRWTDRPTQDWDAVRRLYSAAAEEALQKLLELAYGYKSGFANARLQARFCQAIHAELAELSREFSDTFEAEDHQRPARPT